MTRADEIPDDEFARLRVPPHSAQAEQSVLGAMLLDPLCFDSVSDLLAPSDFYRHEHRTIFTELAAVILSGRGCDVITAFQRLQDKGKAEEVGGLPYLNAVAQSVPGSAHARRYAEIVREKSILRRLIAASDEIATAAFNPQGRAPLDLLREAEAKILAIQHDRGVGSSYVSVDKLTVQVLDRLNDLHERGGGDIVGVSTGFRDLDRRTLGFEPGDLIVLAARPSMGKALSVDAKILTPFGWTRMGDIRIGDPVIGRDGRACPVLGVFPQGRKKLYRVTFDDGAAVLCCDEHLWLTSSRSDRKAGRPGRVRQLSEIRATLRTCGKDDRLNHQIPWVAPMDLFCGGADAKRVLDPYLLGLWLGDGSISGTRVRFHNSEADLIDRFGALLPNSDMLTGSGDDWGVRRAVRNNAVSATSKALAYLGLSACSAETKFVPRQYLWTTAENRAALLRGLLDTDGYCYGAGIEYTTAAPALADAVRFLVRSLGGRITTVVRTPTFRYLGEKLEGLPSHRQVISFDSDLIPVSSLKHLAKYRGVSRRTGRYIAAVEAAGVHEAQCITVGSPDGLFVTDDFVVTHNTALAMNIAENIAVKQALPVGVFSMEMGGTQIVTRMAGSMAEINQHRMRTGNLRDEQWGRLSEAVDKLSKADMFIDESPGLSIDELRSRARRMARDAGGRLSLVVVDYLQLMSGSAGRRGKSDENRATEIGEISRGLKGMAKELKCPVLALSQLNRSVEARNDKRPQMSDLRESGAIEQDADVIMFIYRDDYYHKDTSKEPGIAEIIFAKQRMGPVGTERLGWQGNLGRFGSVAEDYNAKSGAGFVPDATPEDWN